MMEGAEHPQLENNTANMIQQFICGNTYIFTNLKKNEQSDTLTLKVKMINYYLKPLRYSKYPINFGSIHCRSHFRILADIQLFWSLVFFSHYVIREPIHPAEKPIILIKQKAAWFFFPPLFATHNGTKWEINELTLLC